MYCYCPSPIDSNFGLVVSKSPEQSNGEYHVQDAQHLASAREEANASSSLDSTRALSADNDMESMSGTSTLFPDPEVPVNNGRNPELLDALETVVFNIRETMDTFTEEHRSIITIFK